MAVRCCYVAWFLLGVCFTGRRYTTAVRLHSQSEKEIMYIRHGESTGNAGVLGALEKANVLAYMDGTLTSEGKEQVRKRLSAMDASSRSRLLNSEVVLVSPLRRALATSLWLLGGAKHLALSGDSLSEETCVKLPSDYRWPAVEVVAELREKIKSNSEMPGWGTDGDPMDYVERQGSKIGERLFCDEHAMDSVVDAIKRSYALEKARTSDANGDPWKQHYGRVPEPLDGATFSLMIKAFKEYVLDKRPETRVLLVAHSGWARYAFAPFLPAKVQPESASTLVDNLVHGSRKVHGLNNVGVLNLKFANGHFSQDATRMPDPRGIAPGYDEFPNFEEKTRTCMLTSMQEARTAGVVPADAVGNWVFMNKVRDWLGTLKPGIYMFAASKSKGQSYLAYADDWGHTDGVMILNDGSFSFDADESSLQVTIKGTIMDGSWYESTKDSTLQANTPGAYDRLVNLLDSYVHPNWATLQSSD